MLVATALLPLLVYRAPQIAPAPPWERFDLILLEDANYTAAVRSRLEGPGVLVLDRESATVEIEDFRGKRRVTVAALLEEFEADDPRLDPFVLSLEELFGAARGTEALAVVYVLRDQPPRGFPGDVERHLFFQRELEGIPFTRVGWNPLPVVVRTLAAVVLLLTVVVLLPSRRWTVVCIIAPTVIYGALYGPLALVRGIMLAVVWSLFQMVRVEGDTERILYGSAPEDGARRRYGVALVTAVVLAGASIFLQPPEERMAAAAGYGIFLVILGLFSWVVFLVTVFRVKRFEHRLFLPRRIIRMARYGAALPPRREYAMALIVLLALLPGMVFQRVLSAEVVLLPAPVHHSASDREPAFFWTDLGTIPLGRKPLSIAGYIAHRRFQETMMYGGTFAVPSDGEVVSLTRFTREEGRLVPFREERAVLDSQWIDRQLNPDPRSVYALFTVEPGIFSVAPQEIAPQEPGGAVNFPQVLAILGAALLFSLVVRLPYREGIDTVGAVLARGRQRT